MQFSNATPQQGGGQPGHQKPAPAPSKCVRFFVPDGVVSDMSNSLQLRERFEVCEVGVWSLTKDFVTDDSGVLSNKQPQKRQLNLTPEDYAKRK